MPWDYIELSPLLKQRNILLLERDVSYLNTRCFIKSASIDQDLTKVTDNNRNDFVNAINSLKANGGTCLGTGLMRGMDVSI